MLTVMLAAAALSVGSPQETRLEHRGAPMSVTYRPAVTLHLKQVGIATGARADGARCAWTAKIGVERTVQRHSGQLRHAVGTPGWITGSRHGGCDANRAAIAHEVAQAEDRVNAHVARVAAADHPVMLADVDAAIGMASAN